jgi:hypothetical protein
MFGKVKKWLGIEGVKVELSIPEEIFEQQEVINGSIQFYSMHTQTVNSVKVIITEKYYRGRRKKKMIDEYKIGEILMENQFEVPAEEMLEIDFELPFTVIKSEMDKLQGSNFLFKGIIGAAKKLKGVRSVYTVTAEADVDGTKLNPFDKREVTIR